MAYRNDVDALAARKTALEFEVAQKQRERDLAAMLLDEAKARAKLPILDNIRVATPCSADWNEMVGDERVRHCMKCDKDVFNLSQMTRDDAEQLLRDKQGNLCARYFQRADGTILTSDCAVGKQQRRRRRVIAASAAALLAGGGAFTWKLVTHEPAAAAHFRADDDGMQVQGGVSELPIVETNDERASHILDSPPIVRLGRTSSPHEVTGQVMVQGAGKVSK